MPVEEKALLYKNIQDWSHILDYTFLTLFPKPYRVQLQVKVLCSHIKCLTRYAHGQIRKLQTKKCIRISTLLDEQYLRS